MRRNNNIGQETTEKELDDFEKQRHEQFKKDACEVIDAYLDKSENEIKTTDIAISNFTIAKTFLINLIDETDEGDLSDLGNAIGMAIAQFISDKPGFEKEDFISGIEHGISLKDGSHG